MRLTDNPRRDVPICLAICALAGFLLWPVTACGCSKAASKATACLSNVKEQALGLVIYAEDHEVYPARDVWVDGIRPYVRNEAAFHAPEFAKTSPGAYGYAFNSALADAKEPAHPERVPLVYESTNPVKNASDPVTSLPRPGRHAGRNNVGYADGHARRVAP